MSKPRGRPFTPGNTVGRGRPKGSRNKMTSEAQDLLVQYTPRLVMTCIGHAAKGNPTAMRLCMERVLPVNRNASILTNLPQIQTARDLETAGEKVIRDIVRGKIPPADGETLMNILEIQSRISEKGQYESRLAKMEEGFAAISPASQSRRSQGSAGVSQSPLKGSTMSGKDSEKGKKKPSRRVPRDA